MRRSGLVGAATLEGVDSMTSVDQSAPAKWSGQKRLRTRDFAISLRETRFVKSMTTEFLVVVECSM